jgi:hypothetical protein
VYLIQTGDEVLQTTDMEIAESFFISGAAIAKFEDDNFWEYVGDNTWVIVPDTEN